MSHIKDKLANQQFRRAVAPLETGKGGGDFQNHQRESDVIVGHWHEDGNTYEIKCPPQLRDSLLILLQCVNELELKET